MEVDLNAETHRTKERIRLAIGFDEGTPKRYVLNRVHGAPFYKEVYQEMLQSGEIWERGTGKPGDPVMVAAQKSYPNPNPNPPAPVEPDLPTERDALLEEIKSGGFGFILDIGYVDWFKFKDAIRQRSKSASAVLACLIKEWSEGRL